MTVQILIGDCRELLKTLPDESVNCCVCSPPYFGLRDYGVDGQLGLERSPEDFIAGMVEVFREVRRVLRKDGTLWLNIGDSYSTQGGPGWQGKNGQRSNRRFTGTRNAVAMREQARTAFKGLKPKDLVGIPWRLAFSLQADGWWLRQDIIWHKPNPMPESVGDRCTKAHEYLFLLSKSRRYYFDQDAILEPSSPDTHPRAARGRSDSHKWADGGPGNQSIAKKPPSAGRLPTPAGWDTGKDSHGSFHKDGRRKPGVSPKSAPDRSGIRANESWHASTTEVPPMRNKRSVWTVPTQPFSEAHFATYPPELIEPCILAGCPVGGTVLDPFFGAGTTGLVAQRLQRNCIGIELNPEYAEMARRRIRSDLGRVVCDLPEERPTGPLFDGMEAA